MSTLDKLDGLSRKLNIEVPKDDVSKAFNNAYEDIKKNVNVPGFRKGKAPIQKIKSMYQDKVKEDVLNKLISKAYVDALDEHKVDPISYPKIKVDQFEENVDFKFSAEFEVRPEVELKTYEGLEVEKEKFDVDDSQVQDILENMQSQKAEHKPISDDRPIQEGDFVKLDFKGFMNGEPLERGEAEDHVLEIGSQSFIPGFEEGLVGLKKGDEKTVDIKFPDDYHVDDIKGKPVSFEVKIKDIMEKSLPEINDEFATSLSEEFKSLDDLKDKIREDIQKSEGNRIEEEFKKRLLKALVAANPVEVPDTLHQEQKQKLEEDVKNRLKQQGLDDKAIAEYKEKWASEMDEESKFLIQSSFLIDALASKYDLKASKEDLEAKMKTYALQSGIDLEKLMEFYNTPDRRSQLSYQITEDKVIQMLADKAKVKEVPKDKLSN